MGVTWLTFPIYRIAFVDMHTPSHCPHRIPPEWIAMELEETGKVQENTKSR